MLSLIGFFLQTAGGILVGYTAIRVHHRIRQERDIDAEVLQEIGHEERLGKFGILLILIGFALELPSRLDFF